MRSESIASAARTGPEPGFRGLICASFGAADVHVEEGAGNQPRQDLRFESADPKNLARLKSVLGGACVGTRLVLAGPLADIHAAAATAAECGLMGEEVRLLGDESGLRVVFCAHCRTATETAQAVGSEVECRGCATVLAVSGHFSRRIGGYLGFSAHAEEGA